MPCARISVARRSAAGAVRERRERRRPQPGRVDALLRRELADRQRLELGERARAIGVAERAPFDAHVGERGHLRGAERRDLLRREELDLVRLHLLAQAHGSPPAPPSSHV
jgi:hypothetical protein